MAINIWKVGTQNAVTTTLDGAIADDTTTIDLVSTSGFQYPGVLVIDRVDSNNNATPLVREYITYTGVSGNSITGVTRGVAGSTAQAHSSGALVEETWSVTHWGDFLDTFAESHDSTGKLTPQSLATFGQGANVNDLWVTRSLHASGASLLGFDTPIPLRPMWYVAGPVSMATTNVSATLPVSTTGTWSHFFAVVKSPTSGASMLIDVNKNGGSIMGDTVLAIPTGGTFVSTASINIKAYSAGDIFSIDIDAGGGTAEDLTVGGEGT